MSESRPLFLFIESNTSGTGAIFASKAYELGYTPVLVASDPHKYDYACEPWLRLEYCDTYNRNDLKYLAKRLGGAGTIAGVFSSSEYFIAEAATLARSLGLPGPDPARIEACRDKTVQRQTVSDLGIDDLGYVIARSPDEAAARALQVAGPLVVKPARGSGSCGVKLCCTPAETRAHAAHLLALTPDMPILVEDFAPGREYSVELFDGEVCGLVGKHLGAQPHFVEIGHDFPAQVSPGLADRIGNVGRDCARALGITWGPAHVELRTDGKELHLVEVNPRLAGGFIPSLIQAASGVDLIEATILKAVGREPCMEKHRSESAALRFVVPELDGILTEVFGLQKAQAVPGIVSARLYRVLPQIFQLNHDFRDRIGHLLAVGPDRQTANAAVEEAMACIAFGYSSQKPVSFCYRKGHTS